MKKIIYITGLLLMCVGCSRKTVPALPSISNPCDKVIQALIDSVQSVEPTYIYDVITEKGQTDTIKIEDSSNCNYYKLKALEMASNYNGVIKERDYYRALSQSQARKIVNNYVVNSKNRNTQIGDGNVLQEKNKGPAVNGDGNVTPIKPQQSAIGDGNKMDNRSKDRFWLGVLVASGVIIGIYLGWQLAKKYIPGFLPVRWLLMLIGKIKLLT